MPLKLNHLRQQRGASLVEYSLLAGLIAVVAIGSVKTFGDEVSETLCAVSTELGERNAAASGEAYEYDLTCGTSVAYSAMSEGVGETGTEADNFIQMTLPGLIEHPAEDQGWRRMMFPFTESAAENDLFRISSASDDFRACTEFDPAVASFGTVCRGSVDFYAEDALKLGFEYNLDGIAGLEEKTIRIENVTAGGSRLYTVSIDHETGDQVVVEDEGQYAAVFDLPPGTTGTYNALTDVDPADFRNNGQDYLRLTVSGAGAQRPLIEWNNEPQTPSSLRGRMTNNNPGEAEAYMVENWGIQLSLGNNTSVDYDEVFTLHIENPADASDSRDLQIRVRRPAQ